MGPDRAVLSYGSFHSEQNVPISQAAKPKASLAENTCGLVVNRQQPASVPRRESAVGILEPSSTPLLSRLVVCRWTWPLWAVSWAPSRSPGFHPAPAPALPLAAAH